MSLSSGAWGHAVRPARVPQATRLTVRTPLLQRSQGLTTSLGERRIRACGVVDSSCRVATGGRTATASSRVISFGSRSTRIDRVEPSTSAAQATKRRCLASRPESAGRKASGLRAPRPIASSPWSRPHASSGASRRSASLLRQVRRAPANNHSEGAASGSTPRLFVNPPATPPERAILRAASSRRRRLHSADLTTGSSGVGERCSARTVFRPDPPFTSASRLTESIRS